MIQRIQSLYLSLTIIVSLLFLSGSYLTFFDNSGPVIIAAFSGILKISDGESYMVIERLIPLSAVIILIVILSGATILLYKNRKIQLLLSLALIILSLTLIILSVYYTSYVISTYNVEVRPGYKMGLPFLILVFNILAYTGIRRDERLIKSYDRLR